MEFYEEMKTLEVERIEAQIRTNNYLAQTTSGEARKEVEKHTQLLVKMKELILEN